MIKVAIVDDNQINRKTIKEKLLPYQDIHLVFEASNGEEFFDKLKYIPKADLPQVVLMDIEMPVLDGIATISSASIKYPEIKHIVLTIYADDDKIFEAIKAGASGYLLKEDKAINIVEAISNVVEFDGIPMSPAIARRAMELLREAPKPVVPVQNNPTESQLSDREMEILKEVVKGYNHQEIAEKLFISPNTVRTHVNNIYKKLHLNSRSQIMNLAYKNKWI
ncbi:LuxR C-terminal-related transcriptional regulator [Cloacibacterium sp.]|jgi:DNA-binding NarL/FixJ family response regulator|uniref:response regulator transcription factor n=1 Tax=Cloacibacterium sp. TaxID=1913682 RepID=UPI0039E3DAC1